MDMKQQLTKETIICYSKMADTRRVVLKLYISNVSDSILLAKCLIPYWLISVTKWCLSESNYMTCATGTNDILFKATAH
jgi:hypothetical protein